MVVIDRAEADRAALAFALPRRLGSAVTRNRVRRRIREICRDLAKSDQLPEVSYLFTIRGDTSHMSYNTLRDHVVAAVCKATAA